MNSPSDRHSVAGAMFFLVFVSALFSVVATDAVGMNMDAIPSIRLEEGWNSNVFNSIDNEVSSFGTRLTPGLALNFTSPDNVMLQLSGNYEILKYSDSEAKAADSNTWFFRINSTGAWTFTPTLSMLPSVYYLNTSNSFRRSQLVPSGDPVLPPLTITNYGNTNTEDIGAAVNINYLVTPNLTIGVNGNYSEQRFSAGSDNSAGSGLTNSKATGGNVSVSYQLSPRTNLGILFAGNHQTYENAPGSNILSGGILFGHQYSPVLRLAGVFGMSYIRQSEAPGVPEQKDSSPSGLFNVSYTSENFTANVYGSAVYSGGSGYGQATRQYTAGINFSDQFAREWSWNLSGTYQVSKSVFTTDAINLNTTNGTAGLSYRPWEWGSLYLSGNLNRQTSDGQFGSTLDTYSGILGFKVRYPYHVF